MVGDREAVLAAGMNDHIAKPIVVDEMFATLARWLKPARSVAAGDDGPRTDAVLALDGIDTHRGLANIGGDESLFRRMLTLFREGETGFEQHFQAARAAGDAEGAMRAVHNLKGEAGTLGMHGLQQAVTALEQACLDGAREAEVDELMREVSARLNKVIEGIRGLEGARDP
jgi:HPt (histidine-containing phosphotransfer) domain-containing protein